MCEGNCQVPRTGFDENQVVLVGQKEHKAVCADGLAEGFCPAALWTFSQVRGAGASGSDVWETGTFNIQNDQK